MKHPTLGIAYQRHDKIHIFQKQTNKQKACTFSPPSFGVDSSYYQKVCGYYFNFPLVLGVWQHGGSWPISVSATTAASPLRSPRFPGIPPFTALVRFATSTAFTHGHLGAPGSGKWQLKLPSRLGSDSPTASANPEPGRRVAKGTSSSTLSSSGFLA